VKWKNWGWKWYGRRRYNDGRRGELKRRDLSNGMERKYVVLGVAVEMGRIWG